MKVSLKCKIRTDSRSRGDVSLELPLGLLTFHADSSFRVTHVSISRHAEITPEDLPKVTTLEPGRHEITIPRQPIVEELRAALQAIEGFGSIFLGIQKIEWENPEISWTPESDSEKGAVELLSISSDREYAPDVVPIDQNSIRLAVELYQKNPRLIVPMAFYREGSNEYRSFRYINAFYNWYFVLEDLYGKGKTKNKDVEKAFLASPVLTQAVDLTVREFKQKSNDRHRSTLELELHSHGRKLELKDLVRHLVWTRGRLHHFSQDNPQARAIPFSHQEFESIAYFLMVVDMNCLFKEMSYEMPVGRNLPVS